MAFAIVVPAVVSTTPQAAAQGPVTHGAGTVGVAGVAGVAPVVVVALDGAADAAWPLARIVYGDALLHPSLDDTRARILAGDPPSKDADPRLRELSELRSAIRGDDAPSRRILSSLGGELQAQAMLVVWPASSSHPAEARLFIVKDGTFDSTVYRPDHVDSPASPTPSTQPPAASAQSPGAPPAQSPGAPPAQSPAAPTAQPTPATSASSVVAPSASSSTAPAVVASSSSTPATSTTPAAPVVIAPAHVATVEPSWNQTLSAVRQRLVPGAAAASPTAEGAPAAPAKPAKSTAFYASPWFWGALGVAALGGACVYFASRSSSDPSSTVELHGRVVK